MELARLDQAIKAVCPIDGISVSDGIVQRIDFRKEATAEQRAAAQAVVDSFDRSPGADDAWREDQQPERKNLKQAAANAIAGNDTFLALATPSSAQVLAQVKALTRQNNHIISRLIQID